MFYHATPTGNVESILSDGLIPQGTPGRTDLSIVPWYVGFIADMKDLTIADMTVFGVDMSELICESEWTAGHRVTDLQATGERDDLRWLSYDSWLVPGDDGFGTYIYGARIDPKYLTVVQLTEHQLYLANRLMLDQIVTTV